MTNAYPPDRVQADGRQWGGMPAWAGVAILGLIVATAATGVLGGGLSPQEVAETRAASLAIKTPRTVRNGMMFETRIRITAHEPIKEPVLRISEKLWRDTTVNSFVPAPSEEALDEKGWRFTLTPLAAGETAVVHIDGQKNPPRVGVNDGTIALYDGDTLLVQMPVTVRILP